MASALHDWIHKPAYWAAALLNHTKTNMSRTKNVLSPSKMVTPRARSDVFAKLTPVTISGTYPQLKYTKYPKPTVSRALKPMA